MKTNNKKFATKKTNLKTQNHQVTPSPPFSNLRCHFRFYHKNPTRTFKFHSLMPSMPLKATALAMALAATTTAGASPEQQTMSKLPTSGGAYSSAAMPNGVVAFWDFQWRSKEGGFVDQIQGYTLDQYNTSKPAKVVTDDGYFFCLVLFCVLLLLGGFIKPSLLLRSSQTQWYETKIVTLRIDPL